MLALGGDEKCVIGTPTVPDVALARANRAQPRGTKVIVFKKKKRRKNYRRKRGHRQELTVLKIEEIKRGAA